MSRQPPRVYSLAVVPTLWRASMASESTGAAAARPARAAIKSWNFMLIVVVSLALRKRVAAKQLALKISEELY